MCSDSLNVIIVKCYGQNMLGHLKHVFDLYNVSHDKKLRKLMGPL